MPTLLLELGCEELPASACREAEAQLPALVQSQLGVQAAHVYVTPRRIAFVVDDLPEAAAEQLVKGPPAERREQAAAGFAKRYGLAETDLEERDGHLWARVAGEPLRGEPLLQRMRAIVHGLEFGKSMRWDDSGHRFARPVRWFCEKLDEETLAGSGTSFGHRFTHGEVEIGSAQAYEDTLRDANVEPDSAERRRAIVEALDALGDWQDPLGKLDEVVYMVEWPLVFASEFEERFLRLPERVIVTAMQSHQRYFPLGTNRFAVVAAGGEVDVIGPGYTRVLEARLEDAAFTFDRDVAVGIDELAGRLGRITFIEGGGTFADKTERLVELVGQLGGDESAREAARLAKADQASELVREFPDLEGAIGAEYARLAGYPDDACVAIAEHHLPDGADAPLPGTEAGRLLSAADKLDTLSVSFPLGHRPTGSRDPYGLRRAAIGLCRLAVEGGVPVSHELLAPDVREFVEERLEGLLDVPVEFTRAAGRSAAPDIAGVAERARLLASLEPALLVRVHEVYVRSARLAKGAGAEWSKDRLEDDAEKALGEALDAAREPLTSQDLSAAVAAADELAPVVNRFFEEVLVMHENEELRSNRLGLLADVRDTVGAIADFSELPAMSTLVSPELEAQAIAWRRHLHQHPELSFQEHETSAFLFELLGGVEGLELERPTETSLVATLRTGRPGKTLALRADIDALPIQEETGLEFASENPGVMHACGHDGHTAMLLATLNALHERRDELNGEIRFIFQHAEELGPGGAGQLVEAGVMDGVDMVVGAHLFSLDPLGQVGVLPGPHTAASDVFAIEIRGKGGHGAAPHKSIDPITAAAQVVSGLQHVVSRVVDPIERAVVSVTKIHAGTADNIIPESVELGGTVRTFAPEVRDAVRSAMERFVRGIAEAHGCTSTFEYEEGYDSVVNDEAASALVEAAVREELGDDAFFVPPPIMGGEDFSAYLTAAPGAFFIVGAGGDDHYPHHHPRFDWDESAMRNGIAVFTRLALDYLR